MSISPEARLRRLENMGEIRRMIMDYGRTRDARTMKKTGQ